MRLISLILTIYWAFASVISANAQTYYQTIKDPPNDSQDIRQPDNSRFEIYNLTIAREGDITKIIIDSSLPLDGVPDIGAEDGVISWGDLLVTPTDTANYSEIGIIFNPASKLGIYSEMNKVSKVKENFGDKANYGEITSIIPTNDAIGMIEVDYFEGLGINNSNRIVLQMPSSSIPFSSGMIKLAIECYNDFIEGKFQLDLPPRPEPDLPSVEKLPDVPAIPVVERDTSITTTEVDDGFNALPVAVGAGILIVVILLLLNSGSNSRSDTKVITEIPSNPENPENPRNPENPENPKNPDRREIPENSNLLGLLFFSLFFVMRKKWLLHAAE